MCVLPRSLCVDALIELSDENADWKLSFDEFLNCLKPGFNPPEKSELKVIACIFWCNATLSYTLVTGSPDIHWTVKMSLKLLLLSE